MTKKLIPLGDNVIVQPIEDELTTASGIIIPDTVSKEKPRKGKVLSVGPGKTDDNGKLIPIGVETGDVVIFTQYAPTEIKLNGEELYIVASHSLLAIEQ